MNDNFKMKPHTTFAVLIMVACTLQIARASTYTQCNCGGTGRICSDCRGLGYYERKCASCNGTGEKDSAQQVGEAIGNLAALPFEILGNAFGEKNKTETNNKCSECNGKGHVRYTCNHTNGYYECPKCSQILRRNEEKISTSATSQELQSQTSKEVDIKDAIFNKRIKKFGGFYFGEKVKLPDFLDDDYDTQIGNSNWVKDSGKEFRYNKELDTIVMFDKISSEYDGCPVDRYTCVTPKTRLVSIVELVFIDIDKGELMTRVKDEFRRTVGLSLFMDEGQLRADRGRQLIIFQSDNKNYQGIFFWGLRVRIVDLGSFDTEKAHVQALKDKQQNEVQQWIDDLNSRPPFTSFCGIAFGSRLTGDLERTENGEYLFGYVNLKTPFRGCNTAKVYASIKSRRIFRVEIQTKDSPGSLGAHDYGFDNIGDVGVLDKKYNPSGNPLINLNTYLSTIKNEYNWDRSKVAKERKRIEHIVGSRYHLGSDYNLNGGNVSIVSRKIGSGDFYNTVEDYGNYKTEIGVLVAISYKYQEIADQEYKQESGGDGSSVL